MAAVNLCAGPDRANDMRRAPMRAIGIFVFALACVLLMSFSIVPAANAQGLVINTSETATSLVNKLLGPDSGATIVGTPTITGDPQCIGSFTGGTAAGLGLDSGIVLSTGKVVDVVGPNSSDSTTTGYGTPGDTFLDTLACAPGTAPCTFDACILEFQFECPDVESLTFRYQFTSEEFNEFVNNIFNNTFGWELNNANIAIVPGTNPPVPVAINNVNCDPDGVPPGTYDPNAPTSPNPPFCDLFINNDASDGGPFLNVEPDGLIVPLQATGNTVPGTNTIRLAIADAGDSVLDSWVFLETASFKCGTTVTNVLEFRIASLPTNGTLTDPATGQAVTVGQTFATEPTVTYTPNLDFNGTDTFSYEVLRDGAVVEVVPVEIAIDIVDDCTIVGRAPGCSTTAN